MAIVLRGNAPDGSGSGYGYGYGDGSGYGYGYGDGSGYGYGYGDGSGSGYGSGYGDGDGSGYGSGSGSGSGSGYGYGYGDGDGSGYGSGYGDGSGYGSGYGDGSVSNPKQWLGVAVKTGACPSTPRAWSRLFGLAPGNTTVLLFKAVQSDYTSPKGTLYKPGTIPVAPDWDGGIAECGGGLHFSPSPRMAHDFYDGVGHGPARYIACPVALKDIVVHPDGQYPQKVKARGLCAPCWEVDIDGKAIKP